MTAFPWSPSTGYILLGTLGGANSYAMTINDSGAAGVAAQTASGALHAVIWSGGSIRDLGTLGGANSFAYGLNNSGGAAGYSFLAGGGRTHGFFYDARVMLDLNNLTPAGSGWILTQAYAINSSGQIVGAGLFNGVEHAFLLTDPPAAYPSHQQHCRLGQPSSRSSRWRSAVPRGFSGSLGLFGADRTGRQSLLDQLLGSSRVLLRDSHLVAEVGIARIADQHRRNATGVQDGLNLERLHLPSRAFLSKNRHQVEGIGSVHLF